MLDVLVLGPVEARYQGTVVPFARRHQRLILGILALECNREVSCDRLIGLLWEQPAPRQARAAVQSRMSEIRSTLAQYHEDGPVPIVSRGNSYVLQLDPERVDAHRFRTLTAAGRLPGDDEQARHNLRTALALWRGPALGTRPGDAPLSALCQQLEAARLTAWEDLFDLELLLGRHHEVVDEIVELAARHRTRDRLMEHMMLALHRVGRSSEALQGYDRWRRWLDAELGALPRPDLQRLHVSILNNDPGLLAVPAGAAEEAADVPFTAAVPRTLPPALIDFSGRSEQLATLTAALSAQDHRPTRVVAVSGPPGVGKTALALQAAHALRDEFPDGQLYANLRGTDPEEAVPPFDALGRFLRGFNVEGQALPSTLDERAELFRDILATRKVLVVLDDAAGDDQLLPLLPGSIECAVLVTGRARLGTTLGARTVALDLLAPDQALDLLSCIVGAERVAAEPRASARLARLCGYLPLAIRVVGARLAAKPHWTIEKMAALCADEQSRLDQLAYQHLDVRSSIALSYEGLPEEARRLMRLLGDVDLPDATVWISTALLGRDVDTAWLALENLFDANLIDVSGRDTAGYPRYRMHDLVRLFAKERAAAEHPPADLAAARSRAYRFCLTLAEREYLRLFGDGGHRVRGDTPRWTPVGVRAGSGARWSPGQDLVGELLAKPMRWFDHERPTVIAMIQKAARDELAGVCWELTSTVAPMFQMRRDFWDLESILWVAQRATEAAGDTRGRTAVLCRIALNHVDRSQPDAALRLLTEAADTFVTLADTHAYATTLSLLATVERFLDRNDDALIHYTESMQLLRTSGDEVAVAWVLRGMGQAHLDAKDLPQAREHLAEALRRFRAAGSQQGEATALFWLARLVFAEGRPEEALTGFEQALQIARHLTDRPGEAQCLRGIGLVHRALGDTVQARAALTRALDLVRQPRATLLESHIRRTLDDVE
ncbi:DNA-binding SARP family transcriptional activator/Tfp pilus assembly protein PilF [Hamadaea flava]|uniref:BTAD domain-containing putative transcriptional regulator n=1 Tax=Hamadaea flava TaxID=1742688 RepID=A0ABV8LNG8_9ACTN|nr:BTAD domain-containing putative transcriptional regulator [Hamadaea flava]MCP2323105.1 DNA-binding SARP family transcriptional activator/Tfp pilus assembly protein PilF [Hamadaea flava]